MVRLRQRCPRKRFPTQYVLLAKLDVAFQLAVIDARGGDGGDTHSIAHEQNGALSCVRILLDLEIIFNKLGTTLVPCIAVLISEDITVNTWGKNIGIRNDTGNFKIDSSSLCYCLSSIHVS